MIYNIMTINEFFYAQGVIGIIIGTVISYSIANLVRDINKEFIIDILKNIGIKNAGLYSSFIEFFILLLLLYIIYITLLKSIFNKELERENKKYEEEKKWKEQILSIIKDIDNNYN